MPRPLTGAAGFGSRALAPYDAGMDINRASPHDILEAWQAGEITWKRAMRLTGCSDVMELIAAARSSGVEILGLSDLDREFLDRAARLVGNRMDTAEFWRRADDRIAMSTADLTAEEMQAMAAARTPAQHDYDVPDDDT
jgi:hypothetical protein